MADITYYLIRERRLGKAQDDGYFLFDNGEWKADERNVILDHIMGFDPTDDSVLILPMTASTASEMPG